jgi:aminomethyltransferase
VIARLALDHLVDANRFFLRLSPFFEGTEAAGCRAYDHINGYFAGIDYGHTLEVEHEALLHRVVLYDTAIQRQIIVRGPNAREFSNHVFTREIGKLKLGRARYGYLCRSDGVIITDAVVTRIAADEYWFSPTVADVVLWLQGVAATASWDVVIVDSGRATLRVEGKLAVQLLSKATGSSIEEIDYYSTAASAIDGAPVLLSRTASGNLGGFDVYCSPEDAMTVWRSLVATGAQLGLLVKGWGSLDHSTMLEAGVLFFSYQVNYEDRITPLDLPRPFTDLDDGDFIGRAALLAVQRAGGPRRRLTGLIGGREQLPPMLGRWHVRHGGSEIGFTRWYGWSPTLERNIGYAIVAADIDYGTPVDVAFDSGEETMSVARLPFVPPVR